MSTEDPTARAGTSGVTVTARCPGCGQVELPSEGLRLVELSVPERSFYGFVCPRCGVEVRRRAGRDLPLLRLVAPAEFWEVPAEALEPRPETPMTVDDVLDMLLALGELPEAPSA